MASWSLRVNTAVILRQSDLILVNEFEIFCDYRCKTNSKISTCLNTQRLSRHELIVEALAVCLNPSLLLFLNVFLFSTCLYLQIQEDE